MTTYIALEDAVDVEPEYDLGLFDKHEREVLTPALQAAGFRPIGSWYSGDGDSWGPLTRCLRTDRGTIFYG